MEASLIETIWCFVLFRLLSVRTPFHYFIYQNYSGTDVIVPNNGLNQGDKKRELIKGINKSDT